MRKTSVYLTSDEATRLASLAEREGVSQAEVIRRAIQRYEPERLGDREFALTGSGRGPGGSIADVGEDASLEDFGS